ncbi:hypothetical protein PFICI_02600 [Pestalotiopsis fici W106-1]|uniref:Uncharacterized protein n=1 Tax=Pestalotiopsis fici (strain W106-1 / CGMCC3.15140) TaxID=1229662 RepID=W3XEV0_PESFW|nr:uncharacterized protein PFICI_02600 [Pestalotiopsis fici W106-1]ETS84575.1 hypothetical protein PFICI_02600 [Pestalotiopsis fici W106-1]
MRGTTEIILPGGCSFKVWGPSQPSYPYFPLGPDINHGQHCLCRDEYGVMDDDTVFMALWLRNWAEWNAMRVLAHELQDNQHSRWSAYDAFCQRYLDWAWVEWDLPSIGSRFSASHRTEQPIQWFWQSLAGARDLSHCLQPDHARRFVITMQQPPDPSWGYANIMRSFEMDHGQRVASTQNASNSHTSHRTYGASSTPRPRSSFYADSVLSPEEAQFAVASAEMEIENSMARFQHGLDAEVQRYRRQYG